MFRKKQAFIFALIGAIGLSASALALWSTSITISNVGTIRAVGVGIYHDSNCTEQVTSIDWGIVEPGLTTNVTVYIRNEGNTPVVLSMNTTNWNPPRASQFIALTWNYNGQRIDPNGVIQATLTLSVSPDIEGITSYSFDIIINVG